MSKFNCHIVVRSCSARRVAHYLYRVLQVAASAALYAGVTGVALGETVSVDTLPAPAATAFSITPGYSVAYDPPDGINLNGNNVDDTRWNSTNPGWGGTPYSAISSHYVTGRAPELAITVNGLSEPNYDVFARLLVNTNDVPPFYGAWIGYGARLGLDAGNLGVYTYSSGGALLATGDSYDGGTYEMRQFYIGEATTSGGSVTVYLADFAGNGLLTSNLSGLTIASVPEPSGLALAAIGAALAAISHRCKVPRRR